MHAYDHIYYDGHIVNRRTAAMLDQMKRLGAKFRVMQGSYNRGGVAASAGTHDGGGAVDLFCLDGRWDQLDRTGRMVGFAGWVRLPSEGPWSQHWHALAIGDLQMSDGARRQVQDYYAGLNGLVSHRRDTAWRPGTIQRFHFPLQVVDLSNMQLEARKHRGWRARPGVRRIQRALNATTGTHLVVDGIFGPQTKAAYGRYEKQIGGDGDGVPGEFSLSRLGAPSFRVKA